MMSGLLIFLLVLTVTRLLFQNRKLRKAERIIRKHEDELSILVEDRIKELRASEERYHFLFENALVGIGISVRDGGEVLAANEAMCRISGYSPADFKEWVPADTFVNPDDRQRLMSIIKAEGLVRDFETRLYTKSRRIYWANLSIKPIRVEQQDAMLTTTVDITERKQAEEALTEKTMLLNNILNSASDVAIATTDLDFHITYYNPMAEKLFGYTSTEVIGKTVMEMHTKENVDPDRFQRAIETVSSEGEYCYSLTQETGDGLRHLESRVAGIINTSGEIVGYALFSRDVTEYKYAEAELLQHRDHLKELVEERTAELKERLTDVEELNRAMINLSDDLRVTNERLDAGSRKLRIANRELEEFGHSVSHDLKAPLRAISGFAEILAADHRDQLDEAGQRYFDHIIAASKNMDLLISDLLRYARLGHKELKIQPVSLQKLFRMLFTTFSQPLEQCGGTFTFPEDLPYVAGDPTLLLQIFNNLVDNAVKYHHPEQPPQVEISWRREEERIIVSVTDAGIGIDQEDHTRIFDVFQRLQSNDDYPGTGIGLAVVRKAVDMLHARVWVEPVSPQGSSFLVELQRAQREIEDNQ